VSDAVHARLCMDKMTYRTDSEDSVQTIRNIYALEIKFPNNTEEYDSRYRDIIG
jgi:hypothetical protein